MDSEYGFSPAFQCREAHDTFVTYTRRIHPPQSRNTLGRPDGLPDAPRFWFTPAVSAPFRTFAGRALCRPALVLLAAPAPAPAPVALDVDAPAPLACPTAVQLGARADALAADAVIAPDAARRLNVRFTESPPGYVAELTLIEAGTVLGRRRLESSDADCAVLGEAVALAVSILATAPAPEPEREPVPVEPPAPAPASVPASVPAPPTAAEYALVAGLRGSAGDTPGPALAVAAGAERAWGWGRVALEARVDVPGLGAATLAGGDASLWRALAVASLCYGPGRVAACGSVGGGVRRAGGDGYATDHTAWFPALGAGAAVTWDAWRGERFGLRLEAGAWVPFGQTRLRTSAGDAWTAWPVAPAVGAGIRLP
jgi:hypothetical protein